MECAHCRNPNAGNLEAVSGRAFCNAECQRAVYVKGGIFDIVATRKRDVPRDVVYRLMKEYNSREDGEYEYRKLPERLVVSLCLMHNEPVPFSKDHIDKIYNFFFDISNAQALRNTFFWHQDKLKKECMHISSIITLNEIPCKEIFLRLYAMGTFVPKKFVKTSFLNWYKAGSRDVCAIFLKDQVLNLSTDVVNMADIIYEATKLYEADIFMEILHTEQIHINVIYSFIEDIESEEVDDDLAFHIVGSVIDDKRLIGTIPSKFAKTMLYFAVSYDMFAWIKYIILHFNLPKKTMRRFIRSLLDDIQNTSEPDVSKLYNFLHDLLSTNKVELDGIAIYEYNMKTYDILIQYQRARERGEGESSRKYNRMGKLLQ